METVAEVTNEQIVATPTDGAPNPAEQQQQPAQNNQPPEWVPRRMGELAAARRAAEERAQQEAERASRLEQELAQLRAGQQGEGMQPGQPAQQQHPNFDQLVRTTAEQMMQRRLAEQQASSRIAEVDAAARKEFGADYDASVQNLTMAGVGGADFLSVVTAVPNPEKLVTWLGKAENLGEAMRVSSLPPAQMGIEMTKLAGRAAKEMGKQVSKAPPPVEGIEAGGGGSAGGSEPKVGTQEWFEWRNKNARRGRR